MPSKFSCHRWKFHDPPSWLNDVKWVTARSTAYLRYHTPCHSCLRRYCALFKQLGKSQEKQTSSDWFLMTFTRLSLACGQIMGSSVLAAVFRRTPGTHWYCRWRMEQLLTRGLSHNRLARRPKHSKPISGSQYDILHFSPPALSV